MKATLPMKYYDLEKWEMAEYHRKQTQAQQTALLGGSVRDSFNDEEERKAELRRKRAEQEREEFERVKAQMVNDKGKAESMRRQSELQTQLRMAHKAGDTATLKRLERLLAPDEVKTSVKHPWA